MKNRFPRLLAAMLMAVSLPALAGPHDRGHDYDRRFDRHASPRPQPNLYHQRHHSHAGNALAWGAAGLALGGVLFSINPPPPVIVSPAPRPPGRMWYYCDSWQGYYPYVQYCPEGWRAVPAY